MESIVSPWVIYLLSVADSINTFFGILAISGIVGFSIFWFIQLVTEGEFWDKHKKAVKPMLIVVPIFIFLSILIPNSKTIIGMYVASEITYDRAEKAVDIGGEATKALKSEFGNIHDVLKRDIIDIIQEVTKEKVAKTEDK